MAALVSGYFGTFVQREEDGNGVAIFDWVNGLDKTQQDGGDVVDG